MDYTWDFRQIWLNSDLLLTGLVNTLRLSAAAILAGLAFGLVLALGRLSPRRWLSWPATAVIEFYRNTPPLVHFFWLFYGLPIVIGLTLSPFAAAWAALSIQSGAFFAEVFRGGIQSIERGQWEGARALGMTHARIMRRIILPQAIRRMIPPLMERSFELVKTTALAATLAYGDLVYQAMVLSSQTFRPLETYTAVAVIFFAVLFCASLAMRAVEARLHGGGPLMEYQFQFGEVLANSDLLLRGIGVTLALFALSFPTALAAGLVLALGRISGLRWLNLLASAYIEIFRNTPVLVQLIWFYYAFPVLTGWKTSAFESAWLGLFLNTSAYSAEIWRAGLQSVVRGQWEGAQALGMTWRRTLWRVILPQAGRRMIPAFTNRAVELAKMTSISSVITVPELMYQAKMLSNSTYLPMEVFAVTALIYFIVIYPGTLAAYWLERRLNAKGA